MPHKGTIVKIWEYKTVKYITFSFPEILFTYVCVAGNLIGDQLFDIVL